MERIVFSIERKTNEREIIRKRNELVMVEENSISFVDQFSNPMRKIPVNSKTEKNNENSTEKCVLTLGDLLICLFSLISSSIKDSNCSDISDELDKIIESVRWR